MNDSIDFTEHTVSRYKAGKHIVIVDTSRAKPAAKVLRDNDATPNQPVDLILAGSASLELQPDEAYKLGFALIQAAQKAGYKVPRQS